MVLTRTVAAALACGALLAACSSDPQPKFEDSPSPSPSASSASPVVESSSPAEPAQTPKDVVRAWIDARNSALKDGDTQQVDALSASDCRSCEELNKVIRQVYAAGGQFDTAGWSVKSLRQKSQAGPIEVDAAVVFASGTTVQSSGADPVSYDLERHILSFRLINEDGGFLVQTVLFR